ncbi:MAG: DUF2147 domain-containing protein [Hyphomicrobiaceae bacterium]
MSHTAYRQSRRFLASMAAGLAMAVTGAGAALADDATGVWIDNTGRGGVEIRPCGANLCGYVVWVASAKDREGCGEQIIGGLRKFGDRWDNGWIYDPERGRKFDVEIKPLSGNRLRVMGYAGVKFFSETFVWKRAPADLVRCDGQQAAAEPAAPAPAARTAPAPAARTVTARAPAPTATDAYPAPAAAAPAAPAAKAVAPRRAAAPQPAPQPEAPPQAEAQPEQQAAPPQEQEMSAAPAPDAPETQGEQQPSSEEPAPAARDSERRSGSGLPDVAGLPIDKFLKKTAGGNCRLDLPWFKVTFDCKDL